MTALVELQDQQAETNVKEESIYRQKMFFLLRLEACEHCTFKEELGITSSLNCETCIQEALESAGFNTTMKQLDTSQYKIIRREPPINNESEELRNGRKEKKKTYSEKLEKYEAWIIDQIISGNHTIIEAAQYGSLFSQKIKKAFVDVAFENLKERNIIKKDRVSGKYYLVDKQSENNEKESPWNYCVSYPKITANTTQHISKNFIKLEEALAFVQSHKLMNYCIQRRETI